MRIIESALDFWTFIGLFSAVGAVILGAVWVLIWQIVKGKRNKGTACVTTENSKGKSDFNQHLTNK